MLFPHPPRQVNVPRHTPRLNHADARHSHGVSYAHAFRACQTPSNVEQC